MTSILTCSGLQPPVTLREITFDTVRAIIALDPGALRRPYVAPNAVSLAEAHFNPGAWARAVYDCETPVGLVLVIDSARPGAVSRSPTQAGDILLWRFMLDQRYQRQGFGRCALDLTRTHFRARPGARRFVSSYVSGEFGPEDFYLRYGFQKTGATRADGREIEIAMAL